MIRLIEALNYRSLRYVRQPLGPFHVLVGPNASGKTTFLDVISFLGRLVSDGPEAAIGERTRNFEDLLFRRNGTWFELAIEAAIPDDLREKFGQRFDNIRYEVRIGIDETTHEVGIQAEKAWLKPWTDSAHVERSLFPCEPSPPSQIVTEKKPRNWQAILSKTRDDGNDKFYVEVKDSKNKGRWFPAIRLGPQKSALASLPVDLDLFPVSAWMKELFATGVQNFMLNSVAIRQASPAGRGKGFRPDGSNLPWVIAELEKHKDRYADWISHLRTALPDLQGIRTIERPDDKHRYLMLRYQGGLEVPSWVASDGTLRLLAITLPAYLPDFKGVYLIEEPENGIHPGAVETAFQSLSSVYDAQIFLVSHSPVILSLTDTDKVLCFKKTPGGATDIVLGSEHPMLRGWQGETNLGSLFASGVLG